MSFQIPADLSLFSVAGLLKLKQEAEAQYTETFSAIDPTTVSAEELEYTQSLQTFVNVDLPAAIEAAKEGAAAQNARTAAFSALQPPATTPSEPAPADETPADGDTTAAPGVAAVVAATTVKATLTAPLPRPQYSALVAAAGSGITQSGDNVSWAEIAAALEMQARSHANLNGPTGNSGIVQHTPLAILKRDYPEEFTVNGDSDDQAILTKVADERRLPGGNLLESVKQRRAQIEAEGRDRNAVVAAAGWCAPSEVDYSICLQISTDGMFDTPEVQARRGGIRHNTGLSFNSIFGGGTCATGTGPTGYFNLSESQVASGTTKTCLEIPCPSFVDTRLGVTGLCLTGNILSIRGYPEMTETFTRGAVAASAHQVNREQIAAVVTGSTAVDLTNAQPWLSDGSALSNVLSAVEMGVVDIDYNLKVSQGTTMEVVLPWWLLAQFRADWLRRPFASQDQLALADSAIMSAFATRNARVQWVYDWQDAFATCAVSGAVGSATPILNLPKTVQFLMYPAGTWVRAVNDVITLNSVYDSTKLATNQVTHLFTETGWAMLQMCPVSRVYTVPICPSGKTTSTGTLTCP